MLSIFLLIPLSLMLFVVAIWAVRYAVRSNQFEDLDNASQRIILEDRQERRQVIHSHDYAAKDSRTVEDDHPLQSRNTVNDVNSRTASREQSSDIQSQNDAESQTKL